MHDYLARYHNDWNLFAKEILNVTIDHEQQAILSGIQNHRYITVSSGHARGKDYIGAVGALCFLYLNKPSKVILTAPTSRQIKSIMMAEISTIWTRANDRLRELGISAGLGGRLLTQRLTISPNHFLEGFKASDKRAEAWTGYHSDHILVVVSEASGIEDETFAAIDGLLTGTDAKLLLIGNPVRNTGGFYQSFQSPLYKKFVLNSLTAPNVISGEPVIPGQVNRRWIEDRLLMPSWCKPIKDSDVDVARYDDFEFNGRWYRPSDVFRVKVMGLFPSQSEDCLIPRSWVEQAFNRWDEWNDSRSKPDVYGLPPTPLDPRNLRIGADIAGMGNDSTVYCYRYDEIVTKFEYPTKGSMGTPHMKHAGEIKRMVEDNPGCKVYIDSIGEGAGVYSRVKEQRVRGVYPVRNNEKAKRLTDLTGQREFANIRAYTYWRVRDALDPSLGICLCLPRDDDLLEEITSIRYEVRSDGKIQIEKKQNVKDRIGRSPDKLDALALSYYPDHVMSSDALYVVRRASFGF